MSEENKTKFVVEAEARGFDKVQRAVEQVMGATQGSTGKSSAFAQLDKALQGITNQLGKLDAIVGSISRSARDLERSGRISGAGGPSSRQQSDRIEPSFLRGVLQGMGAAGIGISQFLPGTTREDLARQAAGNLVGRAGAAAVGGVASSAFTGISAIAHGIGQIPFAGPLGGAMQAQIAAADTGLEFLRAQRSAAFAMDFHHAVGRMAAENVETKAALAAASGPATEGFSPGRGLVAPNLPVRSTKGSTAELSKDIQSLGKRVREWMMGPDQPQDFGEYEALLPQPRGGSVAATTDQITKRFRDNERKSALQTRRSGGVPGAGGFYQTGMNFGLTATEALQALAEVQGITGGQRGTQLGNMGAAFGARIQYGADLGTSAQVLRGARFGALGLNGPGGSQLAQAAGRGEALGLEGTEVRDYLKRIAEGVSRFEVSGIPIAIRSTHDIARSLIVSGMAPTIAAGRADAMMQNIQGQMQGGLPQSALQYAMLVNLGGYKGGGSEDALGATHALRSGDFKPGGFERMIALGRNALGAGPEAQAEGVYQVARAMGLNLSPKEAGDLASGRMDPKAVAMLKDRAARAQQTGGELEGAGAENVPGGLKSDAANRNKIIGLGLDMMKTVQMFNLQITAMATALDPLTNQLQVLAPLLSGATDVVKKIVRASGVNQTMPNDGS